MKKISTVLFLFVFLFSISSVSYGQDYQNCDPRTGIPSATVIISESAKGAMAGETGSFIAMYDGQCYGSEEYNEGESGGLAINVLGFEVVGSDTLVGVPPGEQFNVLFRFSDENIVPEDILLITDSGNEDPFTYQPSAFFTVSDIQRGNPIPVELTEFVAQSNDERVLLKWRTESETNNSGFEVQRKASDGMYKKIGFVAGNGTTTKPQSYSFEDINLPFINEATYRLKQIDYDGSFEYSPEVEVSFSIENELRPIFPNPVVESGRIQYSVTSGEPVKIVLYDVLGRRVKVLENEHKSAGKYQLDVNTSSLSSGVYFYRISTPSFSKVEKFTVLK